MAKAITPQKLFTGLKARASTTPSADRVGIADQALSRYLYRLRSSMASHQSNSSRNRS
jgi:hypothetical protein